MSEDVQGQDVVQEVEAKEPVQYFLDNGQECSRSAYIRQEFLKNKSRSEIAKELDVSYNIVFSATATCLMRSTLRGLRVVVVVDVLL